MRRDLAAALSYATNRGFQVHPDALKILEELDPGELLRVVKDIIGKKARRREFQICRADLEEHLGIGDDPDIECEARVLADPTDIITTIEGIKGYSALFASRFEKLRRIISGRPEAKKLRPIRGAAETKSKDDFYVCGLVADRSAERNMTRLHIDDPTGSFEGAVFDDELQKTAAALLSDQLVMVRAGRGKGSGPVIKDIILPDVPEYASNRSETEAYAVFLSDLHVGSKYFMEREFEGFVEWLAGPDPVARRVRFVLICGDVVDGVGIYPNQDRELVLQTAEEQLERVGQLLERIPGHVRIVISPGNHDPGRRALPQPAIPRKYCAGLWERGNVTMVGNPATVSLNGVRVAMFHGQSIDDVVKTTPGLSYDRPTDVMRHLLRARHLSPIYGSQTPIAPEQQDLLVMDEVPDIFHVGHVHRAEIASYRGVLLINSGSWQEQTPFQASVGMVPNPGIAILVNLKTFKAFVQNHGSSSDNILKG